MIYLASETKAHDRTLSSSGSFLTIGSIFISGYSSTISNSAAIISSEDVLRLIIKGEKNCRFKTSRTSSSKEGVVHKVKRPSSTNFNNLCGDPCQKKADISTFVSNTIFTSVSFPCDRHGLLLLFFSEAVVFLLLFQLILRVLEG